MLNRIPWREPAESAAADFKAHLVSGNGRGQLSHPVPPVLLIKQTFIKQSRPLCVFCPGSDLDVVVQHPAGVGKVGMFSVDVRQLDGNQIVDLQPEDLFRADVCKLNGRLEPEQVQVITMSLVMGSLFLSREVTTSTMASWSFGNLCSSCQNKTRETRLKEFTEPKPV